MTNSRPALGYSLLELIFVVGLIATVAGATAPSILAGLDDIHALGAVRYTSARLQGARMDAVSRSVNTAMRVSRTATSYSFGIYADGNGDGVRTRDIQRGIDRQIQAEQSLPDQFPGVDFGTLPGLPAVDPAASPPGSDPIRLGSSDMAVFTPIGTATAGSLYILGPHQRQYVIRIFGETGKTRILRFNPTTWQWDPL